MVMRVECKNPEVWELEKIIPNPKNPYRHTKQQIRLLAKIIQAHGWRHPIIVSKRSGFIVAGHGRLMAAKEAGFATAPVDLQEFDNEEQEMAVMMSDNQIDEFRGVDDDLFNAMTMALGPGFDFELAGLLNFEIPQIGLADENEVVEEVADSSGFSTGDIWTMGDHILGVGSSTDKAFVEKVLALTEPAVLMVTDPPYGVNYDPSVRENVEGHGNVKNFGKVQNDDRADWREAYALFQGNVAYIWHANSFSDVVWQSIESVGFEISQVIIWTKQHFAIGRSDYHWQHEPCFYAIRKGAKHNWNGARDQSTVWQISNANAFGGGTEETFGHGTQKPVECMMRPMANNSKKGDVVYDPFLGSGTSIIAAEMSGRKCVGIEIDLSYAAMIVKRWEKFTGKKAEKMNV